MTTACECRVLAAIIGTILIVGAGCSLARVADLIAAAILLGAGLAWLTVVMVRRELRIRARLADPRTRDAAHRLGSGVS